MLKPASIHVSLVINGFYPWWSQTKGMVEDLEAHIRISYVHVGIIQDGSGYVLPIQKFICGFGPSKENSLPHQRWQNMVINSIDWLHLTKQGLCASPFHSGAQSAGHSCEMIITFSWLQQDLRVLCTSLGCTASCMIKSLIKSRIKLAPLRSVPMHYHYYYSSLNHLHSSVYIGEKQFYRILQIQEKNTWDSQQKLKYLSSIMPDPLRVYSGG